MQGGSPSPGLTSPGPHPGTPGRAVTYENMVDDGMLNPGDPGYFFLAWVLEERAVIPMVCMGWWGVHILITLLTQLIWFRTDAAEAAFGSGLIRAHLVFMILGMIVYFTIAASCWYYAAQFAATRQSRKQKTILGIMALWFLRDMPLWAIEYTAIKQRNDDGLQVTCFVFATLSFLTGGIVVWLTYAYKASSFLQLSYAPPLAAHPACHTGSVFPERGGGIAHIPPAHAPPPLGGPPPLAGPPGGFLPHAAVPRGSPMYTPEYSGHSASGAFGGGHPPGGAGVSFGHDPLASVSPQRPMLPVGPLPYDV